MPAQSKKSRKITIKRNRKSTFGFCSIIDEVDDREPYAPVVDLSFIGEEVLVPPAVVEDVAFSDISTPSPQNGAQAAAKDSVLSPSRANLNNKYVGLPSPLLPDSDVKWSNTPPGRQPNWTPGSTNLSMTTTSTPPREYKNNPWADLEPSPVVPTTNPNPGAKIDSLMESTTAIQPAPGLAALHDQPNNPSMAALSNASDRWLSEPNKSAEFYPANYDRQPDPIAIADWSSGSPGRATHLFGSDDRASSVPAMQHPPPGHPEHVPHGPPGMPPPPGYPEYDPHFNAHGGPPGPPMHTPHGPDWHAHQHGHYHGHAHSHQHQHQHQPYHQPGPPAHGMSRLSPNAPPFQSGKGMWNPQASPAHPPPPPTGWAPVPPPGWSEMGSHGKSINNGLNFISGTKCPELAALGDNPNEEEKLKAVRAQRKKVASNHLSQALGRLTCPADREIKIEDFICAFVDVHAIIIEDPPERIMPGFSCYFDFGSAFVRKGALEGANNARCRATVIALPVGTRGSLLAQSGNRSLFKSLGNGSHDFHRYRRTYGFGANCHVCLSTREFASYHGWYWAICSSPNRNVSWSVAAALMSMVAPRKFTGQFLLEC
jgi:hypothetical protein